MTNGSVSSELVYIRADRAEAGPRSIAEFVENGPLIDDMLVVRWGDTAMWLAPVPERQGYFVHALTAAGNLAAIQTTDHAAGSEGGVARAMLAGDPYDLLPQAVLDAATTIRVAEEFASSQVLSRLVGWEQFDDVADLVMAQY